VKVLKLFRLCLASFALLTALIVLPPIVIRSLGGDIQAWKWFVVFYGGLALMLTALFAVLCLIGQIALLATRKWHKAHG
jgi:hypothetical protein